MKTLALILLVLFLSVISFGQSTTRILGKCPTPNQKDLASVSILRDGRINTVICPDNSFDIESFGQKVFSIKPYISSNSNYSVYAGYGINPNNAGVANFIFGGYYNTLLPNTESALLTGSLNNFFGGGAGVNTTTGNFNSGFGDVAIGGNTTGQRNVAFGGGTGVYQQAGFGNTYIGFKAGGQLGGAPPATTVNSNNVFLGHEAGYHAYACNDCTMLGFKAGVDAFAATGSVFIGNFAGANEQGANKLYIANTNTATPLIYGEFDNAVLKIAGTLFLLDGTMKQVTFAANDSCGAGFKCLRIAN